jgi:hypothetical protein
VSLLGHPAAPAAQVRTAVRRLEDGIRTDQWAWDLVESALTEVCSPWPAPPGRRIERGLFFIDHAPVGVPETVDVMRSVVEVQRHLLGGQVSERHLEQARQRYLWRYESSVYKRVMPLLLSPELPWDPDFATKEIAGFLLELSKVLRSSGDLRRHG